MTRMTRIFVASFVLCVSGIAQAQSERSSSTGNAQLMRQMQQLASERAQLQAENARLKQELDSLKRERDSLKGDSATLDKRLRAAQSAAARSEDQQSATTQELTQLRSRMEELVGKFRETAGVLRDVESQRATVVQDLATRDVELAQCTDRNQKLYALNDEILTRFGDRGFWSGLASAEPFTKLKRVQNENLIGEYRAKAEDQSVGQARP